MTRTVRQMPIVRPARRTLHELAGSRPPRAEVAGEALLVWLQDVASHHVNDPFGVTVADLWLDVAHTLDQTPQAQPTKDLNRAARGIHRRVADRSARLAELAA